MGFTLRPTRSAMPSTMPSTINVVPITQRLRNSRSMRSSSASPTSTIGVEPMMMNQPRRHSGSSRAALENTPRTQPEPMVQMSRQK